MRKERRKFSSLRAVMPYCVMLLAQADWRQSRTMRRKKITWREMERLADYAAQQRRREFGVNFVFRGLNHDEITVPHCEGCMRRWRIGLCLISKIPFALLPRLTTGNVDRFDVLSCIPHAFWLLARCQVFKHTNPVCRPHVYIVGTLVFRLRVKPSSCKW